MEKKKIKKDFIFSLTPPWSIRRFQHDGHLKSPSAACAPAGAEPRSRRDAAAAGGGTQDLERHPRTCGVGG